MIDGRLASQWLLALCMLLFLGCSAPEPTERPEPDQPEVEQMLSERLDALKRSLNRDVPEIRQELSDADRERLRTLGYAAESPSSEGETR